MKQFSMLIFVGLLTSATAFGAESEWELRPAVGVGYNKSQGSYWSLGLNFQKWFNENVLAGVGAFYSVGSPAESTHSFGAGPFVGYYYPLTDFLTGMVRQEVDYVSQRTPLETDENKYTTDSGVISVTSIGLSLSLGDHFGITGGYRFVLALSDSDLDDDRSGTFLGFGISL